MMSNKSDGRTLSKELHIVFLSYLPFITGKKNNLVDYDTNKGIHVWMTLQVLFVYLVMPEALHSCTPEC